MKHFLIKYRFKDGSRGGVARADRAVHRRRRGRRDPERPDRLSLHESRQRVRRVLPPRRHRRTTKLRKALQSRDFFKAYTDETKRVSGGTLEVLPLAIIAEKRRRGPDPGGRRDASTAHAGVGHALEFGPALRVELAEPAGVARSARPRRRRIGSSPRKLGRPPRRHAGALAGGEKGAMSGCGGGAVATRPEAATAQTSPNRMGWWRR